jgi:putative sterol carrier protein
MTTPPPTPALDPSLKDGLLRKIRDGEFGASDIGHYLVLFCAAGNEDADLQEEVEGWDRRIQLALESDGDGGEPCWVSVMKGHFSSGGGAVPNPDLTLRMTADEAARILTGDKDAKASYLAGSLKVEGQLPDAIRFQTLVGLVIDALDL